MFKVLVSYSRNIIKVVDKYVIKRIYLEALHLVEQLGR